MQRLLVLALFLAANGGALDAQQSCWTDRAEPSGQRGNDWVVQRAFDSLRVCALANEMLNAGEIPPTEWLGRAPAVVLETSQGSDVRVMRVAGSTTTFTVNGSARAMDDRASEWRRAVLDVVDATWRLDRLRARERALQADMLSTRSEGASEVRQISAPVQADVIELRAELNSLNAEWKSLSDEVSRNRADLNRLSADIRDEHNSISNLRSQLSSATGNERTRINNDIQRHYQEIRRIEANMRRLEMNARSAENRIATVDFARRVQRIEREILAVDTNRKPPEAEQRASDQDVEGRIAAIQRQIAALDVDRTSRDLEARIEAAGQRLRATLGR